MIENSQMQQQTWARFLFDCAKPPGMSRPANESSQTREGGMNNSRGVYRKASSCLRATRVSGHTATREVRGDKRLGKGAADIQNGEKQEARGAGSHLDLLEGPTNYGLGKSQAGTNGAGAVAVASGTAPA